MILSSVVYSIDCSVEDMNALLKTDYKDRNIFSTKVNIDNTIKSSEGTESVIYFDKKNQNFILFKIHIYGSMGNEEILIYIKNQNNYLAVVTKTYYNKNLSLDMKILSKQKNTFPICANNKYQTLPYQIEKKEYDFILNIVKTIKMTKEYNKILKLFKTNA